MTRAGVAQRLIPLVLAARLTLVAVALAALLATVIATVALGADPTIVPSPDAGTVGGLLEGGDPRSEGAGPGLVGAPVLILLGVVALGLATTIVTAVFVRLTRRS